jgi:hypothetical protein
VAAGSNSKIQNLFAGHWPVLHAVRHDEKFALFELHGMVAELHAEAALNHQEQLILGVRPMPLPQVDLPHAWHYAMEKPTGPAPASCNLLTYWKIS